MLTANPINGTPPYFYLWYSGFSSTCISDTSTGITTSNYLVSPPSNTFYCYLLTDSASNTVFSPTKEITVVSSNYALPQITSVQITPNQTIQNTNTTFSVDVLRGTFPVNTITWQFGSSYFTDYALNGTNYQSYKFGQAGTFSSSVQVCDSNGYCTMASYAVFVKSLIPLQYWTVNRADVPKSVTSPQALNMRLYFQPHNDTNPIASVAIDWGDQSPLYVVDYPSGRTSDLYIHTYTLQGTFNITATICDTLNNCITIPIEQVTDVPSGFLSGILTALIKTSTGQSGQSGFQLPFQIPSTRDIELIIFVIAGIIILIIIVIFLVKAKIIGHYSSKATVKAMKANK
jgi:hypothetical protein